MLKVHMQIDRAGMILDKKDPDAELRSMLDNMNSWTLNQIIGRMNLPPGMSKTMARNSVKYVNRWNLARSTGGVGKDFEALREAIIEQFSEDELISFIMQQQGIERYVQISGVDLL